MRTLSSIGPRGSSRALTVALLAWGVGCKGGDGDTGASGDGSADLDAPPAELVMPDLEGIDIDQAFIDAIEVALTANTQLAWAGHSASLARQHTGCPDLYVGPPPDLVDDDLVDEDASGTSWYDSCTTPGGLFYRGGVYWESGASGRGDPEDSAGRTETGSRQLVGSAVVGDPVDTRFQFRGESTDSVNRVVAPGYERWTYTSSIEATLSGLDAFDEVGSLTPGGFRTGMYTSATGGDADTLELRGDVYLFEHRIQHNFDSVSIDIRLPGPAGSAPDACTAEPRGWIGLRDENAFWIDVVFMPLEGQDSTGPSYEDPSYSECDGCGTVYVRGIQAEPLGVVCPGFEGLWEDGVLPVPEIADYVLDVRDIF